MKKLALAAVLSVFSVSAAYACDGMKDHQKTSDQASQASQGKKDTKKDDAAKGVKS